MQGPLGIATKMLDVFQMCHSDPKEMSPTFEILGENKQQLKTLLGCLYTLKSLSHRGITWDIH